jgi:hypothetical protein
LSKGLFDRLEAEVEAHRQGLGLKITDLLTLPEALSDLLNWIIRQEQVSHEQALAFVGQDEAARSLLAEALDKGYLREIEMHGQRLYRVRIAPRHAGGQSPDLWQSLEGTEEEGTP